MNGDVRCQLAASTLPRVMHTVSTGPRIQLKNVRPILQSSSKCPLDIVLQQLDFNPFNLLSVLYKRRGFKNGNEVGIGRLVSIKDK